MSILPRDCVQPAFKGQTTIVRDGLYELPEKECFIYVLYNALSETDRANYLQQAVKVDRKTGQSGFGPKPRSEVCYTPNGQPYKYSGKNHYTTKYPSHVEKIIPSLLRSFSNELEKHELKNQFTILSNAVDIIYSDAFPRGGSISAHKDNEQPWGLVLVFSLGQTRWLRVRHDTTKEFFNVQLRDNSLVAMFGKDFQKCFTHQVDKLSEKEFVGTRLSLNVRFLSSTDE